MPTCGEERQEEIFGGSNNEASISSDSGIVGNVLNSSLMSTGSGLNQSSSVEVGEEIGELPEADYDDEVQRKKKEFTRRTYDVRHKEVANDETDLPRQLNTRTQYRTQYKREFGDGDGIFENMDEFHPEIPGTSRGSGFGRGRGRYQGQGRNLMNEPFRSDMEDLSDENSKTQELGRSLFGGDIPFPENGFNFNNAEHADRHYNKGKRSTMADRSVSSSDVTEQLTEGMLGRYSKDSDLKLARLLSSTHNDGLLGRFPGDSPKNYNGVMSSARSSLQPRPDDFNSLLKTSGLQCCLNDGYAGAMVTDQGIISIGVTGGTRIDISLNKGIRVVNEAARIAIALSPNGTASALIHPSGKVYQYGSRAEVSTNLEKGNKVAKMWYKGITFSTEKSALVYMLDDGGTRTVHDVFSDMTGDFTAPVFLTQANIGPNCVNDCLSLLKKSQYWVDEMGLTENWEINRIRISRTPDDVVRVLRGGVKYQIRICGNGIASISTPFMHCTASCGKMGPESSHLFVRRGERRLHYDGTLFILRNAGHSAGIGEHNEFRVF